MQHRIFLCSSIFLPFGCERFEAEIQTVRIAHNKLVRPVTWRTAGRIGFCE